MSSLDVYGSIYNNFIIWGRLHYFTYSHIYTYIDTNKTPTYSYVYFWFSKLNKAKKTKEGLELCTVTILLYKYMHCACGISCDMIYVVTTHTSLEEYWWSITFSIFGKDIYIYIYNRPLQFISSIPQVN